MQLLNVHIVLFSVGIALGVARGTQYAILDRCIIETESIDFEYGPSGVVALEADTVGSLAMTHDTRGIALEPILLSVVMLVVMVVVSHTTSDIISLVIIMGRLMMMMVIVVW